MSLQFARQDGVYNADTQAVRFFATDGKASVMFTISREALSDMERAESLTPKQVAAAHRRHLLKIRDVARKVYAAQGPGRSGPYILKTEHF
ncbi:DUF1488 domain-containing protein [Rhodospirillaceae bacterium SYSU D60014]|uniref:DUF1488 domain-containing protein n=1 Tax=Virgifigura deserti TaxID=2268457 RepID=UPI000E67144F